MREASTAEVLPVPVLVNGRTYLWTAQAGLDPEVVGEIEAWIHRRAQGFSTAARMRGLDLDDLLQEGRAGTLRAARTFDPSAGSTFLHYADALIRQAMLAALNQSHAVYMPRRHRNQAIQEGSLPGVVYLDAPAPNQDASLLDIQPADQPNPLDDAVRAETSLRLRQALARLTVPQRRILSLYFGLHGRELSLEAIGRDMGCSREHLRLELLRAGAKLRRILQESPMEAKPTPHAPLPVPQGRQITVQDVIRDRRRQERAADQQMKASRKAAREATRGVPLFEEI